MVKRGSNSRETPNTWQASLDRWHPTLVRYAGLALMLYAALTREFELCIGATGMILYKTVYGDGSKE